MSTHHPVIVWSGSASYAGVTQLSLTPSGVLAGDRLIAFLTWNNTTTNLTGLPTGFGQGTRRSGNGTSTVLSTKLATDTSDNATLTWTLNGTRDCAIAMIVVRDCQSVEITDDGGSYSYPPSQSTSGMNATGDTIQRLVVCGFSIQNAATLTSVTPRTGWDAVIAPYGTGNPAHSIILQYCWVGATTSVSATLSATYSASRTGTWAAVILKANAPFQAVTTQHTGGGDTMLDKNNPSTNFQLDNTMEVGTLGAKASTAERALLKFPVGLLSVNIANDEYVDCARVRVSVTASANPGALVYAFRVALDRVGGTPNIATATWDNYATGAAWPGGDGGSGCYDPLFGVAGVGGIPMGDPTLAPMLLEGDSDGLDWAVQMALTAGQDAWVAIVAESQNSRDCTIHSQQGGVAEQEPTLFVHVAPARSHTRRPIGRRMAGSA